MTYIQRTCEVSAEARLSAGGVGSAHSQRLWWMVDGTRALPLQGVDIIGFCWRYLEHRYNILDCPAVRVLRARVWPAKHLVLDA